MIIAYRIFCRQQDVDQLVHDQALVYASARFRCLSFHRTERSTPWSVASTSRSISLTFSGSPLRCLSIASAISGLKNARMVRIGPARGSSPSSNSGYLSATCSTRQRSGPGYVGRYSKTYPWCPNFDPLSHHPLSLLHRLPNSILRSLPFSTSPSGRR